ncbi:MAG: HNH endonuclease signature motif containing protein [Pseudomonadota bacterium]
MTGRSAAFRREGLVRRVKLRCRIDAESGCWLWQGPTSGTGRGGFYPRMSLDGQTVAVHRVMAVHAFGYLHANRHVDHLCRNRLCVNPAHLEPITHKENCRRRDQARAKTDTEGHS